MNLAVVEQATDRLVARGERLLHCHRFAATDAAHCARLARWAELPTQGQVVDLGCGTGELVRHWAPHHPDLTWVLVNISAAQLAHAPAIGRQQVADMRAVPEPDGSCVAALCTFAIGHVPAEDVYTEMARLVQPGGVVWVYDLVCEAGYHLPLRLLDYTVGTRARMETLGRQAGLILDTYLEPRDHERNPARLLGAEAAYFTGTRPAIWRWIRP